MRLLRMISEQLHFAPNLTGKLSEKVKTFNFINATYQFHIKLEKAVNQVEDQTLFKNKNKWHSKKLVPNRGSQGKCCDWFDSFNNDLVARQHREAVLTGWQWEKINLDKWKYSSMRVNLQTSVGLSLDKSGEHGKGSNWFVWWNHVTRTLQVEFNSQQEVRSSSASPQ